MVKLQALLTGNFCNVVLKRCVASTHAHQETFIPYLHRFDLCPDQVLAAVNSHDRYETDHSLISLTLGHAGHKCKLFGYLSLIYHFSDYSLKRTFCTASFGFCHCDKDRLLRFLHLGDQYLLYSSIYIVHFFCFAERNDKWIIN